MDGTPSNTDDRTTDFTFDANDSVLTVKALLTGGGYQTTQYVYATTIAAGSVINSNDVLFNLRYADPTTGNPSSSEQETVRVNALGEIIWAQDRNGTIHDYTRDVLGRVIVDAVTTLGTGVDGAVRRLETAVDTQGNAYLFTSYDAVSGGNIVNQVKREFNGFGQMTKEWQSHSGAVSGSTPYVLYTYSNMSGGANHSRLTQITYPNGKVVNYFPSGQPHPCWPGAFKRRPLGRPMALPSRHGDRPSAPWGARCG